jgi:hypothetical protein
MMSRISTASTARIALLLSISLIRLFSDAGALSFSDSFGSFSSFSSGPDSDPEGSVSDTAGSSSPISAIFSSLTVLNISKTSAFRSTSLSPSSAASSASLLTSSVIVFLVSSGKSFFTFSPESLTIGVLIEKSPVTGS